jgi:hypothetical protein
MENEILVWLDGKKAIIGGLINAITVYLLGAGVISQELGALVTSLVLILTGVAIQQTNKILGARNRTK